MKLLAVLTLACAGLASAQVTGLATVGLAGDPNNPTIINSSDKSIIAAVVVRENEATYRHTDQSLFLTPFSAPILPGTQAPSFRRAPATHTINGLWPQEFIGTKARLDLVVFQDGSAIGEDSQGSADAIATRLKAIVKAGQMALAGQWGELAAMHHGRDQASADFQAYGYQLAWTRDHTSEAEALRLAKICASLPTALRKSLPLPPGRI